MNSSNEEESTSNREGIFIARQPIEWFKMKNSVPSPSELITFHCPYNLRNTEQFRYKNQLWTVGDIVSLTAPISNKIIYAQIVELSENNVCEKRAKIMWLAPILNVGVTDESKKVLYNNFKPNAYVHVNLDKRLVPIQCLTFVMNVPNLPEYKKHIGINYLVNTQIISHAERYAESDEDPNDGPKRKAKVRQLLNK